MVRAVWKSKFRPNRDGPRQSNVDLAVLDSTGHLVYQFDGFAKPGGGPRPPNPRPQNANRPSPNRQTQGRPESLAQYTSRHLRRAVRRMDSSQRKRIRTTSRVNSLELPNLGGASEQGIRVFVRLMDDRMKAYQAPVVVVVPLDDDAWSVLSYPTEPRLVDARKLEKWLSKIYPPGIMERTNPRTKKVYEIKSTEGKLTLTSAGSNEKFRYAVLTGFVRLTDEGADPFSFSGKVSVVITYPQDESAPHSLRGVFDGIYPRFDRRHERTRRLPLRAAFESLPK